MYCIEGILNTKFQCPSEAETVGQLIAVQIKSVSGNMRIQMPHCASEFRVRRFNTFVSIALPDRVVGQIVVRVRRSASVVRHTTRHWMHSSSYHSTSCRLLLTMVLSRRERRKLRIISLYNKIELTESPLRTRSAAIQALIKLESCANNTD